jgi:polyisoprenoid-binding protein YceI
MNKRILLSATLVLTTLAFVGCGKASQVGVVGEELSSNISEYTGVRVVEGGYQVDVERSMLRWSADRVLSPGHTGSIDLKSGSVLIEDGVFSGSIVVDMDTMVSDKDSEATLIKHLKSADFFDVDNFSESNLKLNSVNYVEGDNTLVSGSLTIKAETRDIMFPAHVTGESDGSYTVSTELTIDRTLWGLKYGSESFFDNLGDKAISNDIKFNLTLHLIKNEKAVEQTMEKLDEMNGVGEEVKSL